MAIECDYCELDIPQEEYVKVLHGAPVRADGKVMTKLHRSCLILIQEAEDREEENSAS